MKTPLDTQHSTVIEELQRRRRAGVMVLLFTDMVGSARLKDDLGDFAAAELIGKHHDLVRSILARYPAGQEIETAGDSFFITFSATSDAVRFALQLQAELRELFQSAPHPIRDRIGIHAGEVLMQIAKTRSRPRELIGIHVDTCARVMSICPADRILITRFAFDNARQALKGQSIPGVGELKWESHGLFRIKGVDEPLEICEVAECEQTEIKPLEQSEKVEPLGLLIESSAELNEPVEDRSTPGPLVQRYWKSAIGSWRYGAMGVAFVSIATLILLVTPLFTVFENLSYDSAFLFRSTTKPDGVVIVYMDDASRKLLNQQSEGLWDRTWHAKLIDRLTASRARAVVFDVLFEQKQTNQPAADQLLIAAVRRNGSVFLAAKTTRGTGGSLVVNSETIAPFPELRQAAKGWGLVQTGKKTDHTVRKHLFPGPEDQASSLAEKLVEFTSRASVTNAGVRWMNFYGPPWTIPSHNYSDALDTATIPDSMFSNKVVFVGSNMSTTPTGPNDDYFITPYFNRAQETSTGVEINATAYLNLARGDWLTELGSWKELALFMSGACLLGFGLALLRPPWAVCTGVGAGLLACYVSNIWVWRTHVWFPWAVVSLVQVPCGVAWSILAETQRLKNALDRLRAARRSVAKAASQLTRQIPHRRPPTSDSLTPGPPLVPDYNLLRTIGRGAYGEVWLAQDVTGAYYAIKIVYRASFKNLKPFEREFQGVRKFSPISRSHPNLINILHVGRNDRRGYFYYAMELADDERQNGGIRPGAYSPRTLRASSSRTSPWPTREAIQLGIELCGALECLHDHGLVHRDIKPGNVLFVRAAPKLADIGLVTELVHTGEQQSAVGTLGYMAPEGPGTAQADLYSLGKLLYEIAFGQLRERFGEPARDMPRTPSLDATSCRFQDIITKACAQEPRCRWKSARELQQALRELEQSLKRDSPRPAGNK